ncbi:glycosyltransferase family 2 protein [Nocardioides jejuensis]|uniref:glycosyltransferase family 2 protein n=1 Tax=Nocardioides jejuensis TaxID=2502782 RepID=UPI001404F461|nr:glycosyltransferase family 2 protein [Nocardioides jejuensis]
MLTTPVVMVAFNRPHLTEQTLAAVREARPRELFLVVDGPRAGHPTDAATCAATRAVLDGIDWECTVHRRYAETNLGLEANVELGLDWAFSQVDRAIVLEDDCVAGESFFRYMDELLTRYADDDRIWQVSGSGLGVPEELFHGDSYAFTAWASVWGWGTWADRWQRHRAILPRDHRDGDAPVRTKPFAIQPGLVVTKSAERHFRDAAASDDTHTHGWDKHFWLTMMTEGGYAISPSRNLVENVGWGEDATHAASVSGRTDHSAIEIAFPLVHPQQVVLNAEVERELELILNRVGGRAATFARRLVRSPRLRYYARLAVNSQLSQKASRAASRMTDRSPRG